MTPPRIFSALPPFGLYKASPKAISGRTSYLRVRLEFLPYPHLIATLFNGCAFGPPLPFTAASSWTWVDHPVSGLSIRTSVIDTIHNFALLRLGFPSAPHFLCLTLPVCKTRRTVLQKVRGPSSLVPQLVDTGFQVLFHSPPGVLFTFPSQYSSLSVTEEYLALGGGPPFFLQGFSCPVVLWILLAAFPFSGTGLSPSLAGFPKTIPLTSCSLFAVLTPPCSHRGLGSFPFARRYLENRGFFLFLWVLRCFNSPGSPL